MATSSAQTADAYLAEIEDPRRREAMERLLAEIRGKLDPRFEEGIDGMIHWSIPHALYPAGYHCTPEDPVPFLALASQKRHISLYDMGLVAMPEAAAWFDAEFAKTGWRLDRGKSCIRFSSMARIPYELIGKLAGRIRLDDYLEAYRRFDPRNREASGTAE